jgi:hypothetical protein
MAQDTQKTYKISLQIRKTCQVCNCAFRALCNWFPEVDPRKEKIE